MDFKVNQSLMDAILIERLNLLSHTPSDHCTDRLRINEHI